ncbi:SpoIIE family protein phosphatase [Clostridiales bacterium]|nr:SpoIIE family protein phosphatase [Clostridiales bacterium]
MTSLRKFRKLVIGGIESKIVLLIIAAMLLLAGVFLAVTQTQNKLLVDLSGETNERQLAAMSGTTAGVIDTVITQNMDSITDKEAQLADEMFRDVAARVRMVGDYAQKLLENADGSPRAPWNRPDPSKNGELFAKVLFAEGVDEAALEDRVGIIANMGDMMISLCKAYGGDNIWFSLAEGATLMVDDVPDEWILDDGSYETYNATERYWYKQAAQEGKLVFSDVEIDRRTWKKCVTCALPVYGADGKLLGVAGADIFLTDMQAKAAASSDSAGILLIVNQNGHVVVAPDNQDVFPVLKSVEASDLRESDNSGLASLVKDALQSKTDVRMVSLDNGTYYMIGVPMKTPGWAMITAFSEEVAGQPVRTIRETYNGIQAEAAEEYRTKTTQGQTLMWIILGLLLAALVGGALLAGRKIVKPLNTITKRISEIGGDNLQFRMEDEYRTGDEVEVLAKSFADLSAKTMDYIDQVTTVTAEKERIGTELHVAREIQKGMLPGIFPPYPERSEFDLYAAMDPAKEVGGDFYDFFLIDHDHLAMVMADVSGKGIPAALFMMVSKTILKNNAMLGKSPAEILVSANETICSNNKMQMFVTVWMGILEISTGKITAANAGHEYPAIRRAGAGFELLKDKHGFVVGGMEGIRYKEYEIQLNPGDKLFLYTDGVPEATNAEQELFGTDRMVTALDTGADGSARDVLVNVRKSVDAFVQDAEQFDDLTMLCLDYKG